MNIAVIGSNNVDLITYINRMPGEGETIEAPDFALGCGGKGANQAVAASRLGSKVLMVSRVGNDIFADNTLDNFRKNGIDDRYILRTEATSGVAPIFVDEDGKNSIIIVQGANALLSPADLENARDAIAECSLIVLQLEIALETVYAAIDLGAELGIPVLLNPAPAHPELSLERVKGVDFIVPNETELSLLTGMPVENLDDISNAAQVLLKLGIKNVIVTVGQRGALWVSEAGSQLLEGQSVQAVDTSGAGDAFIGCFSHFFVQTGDIAGSLAKANKYAADSVTKRGTQTSYSRSGDLDL